MTTGPCIVYSIQFGAIYDVFFRSENGLAGLVAFAITVAVGESISTLFGLSSAMWFNEKTLFQLRWRGSLSIQLESGGAGQIPEV